MATLKTDSRPSVKEILQRLGIQPKQSLGQNFLLDEGLLRKIVEVAQVQPHDHVLEIGAGAGTLTRALAQSAETVIAVELDQRLLPVLDYQLFGQENVRVIHGDILELNPRDLFDRPYIVVANVPYYITGAILRHLLGTEHKPTRLILTVQKEVADRIVATPPDMSLLAVSVQFFGRARVIMNLPAGAFWPRPQVDSAVVQIELWKDRPNISEKAFFRLVKVGFSQKRKQLKNNLRGLGLPEQRITHALELAEIEGQRRAETLTIAEWQTLANLLQ